MALKRLNKQLAEFQKHAADLPNIAAGPIHENDCFNWLATIVGWDNTPYAGGVFYLNIQFTHDYPIRPPKCTFITKVYHPNIDANGKIWLDILMDQWSPTLYTITVLLSISLFMNEPNPYDCSVPEISKLYLSNRAQYEAKAKQWTKKYAR